MFGPAVSDAELEWGRRLRQQKITDFRMANSENVRYRTDADFVIKLGDYKWSVHMEAVADASAFFECLTRPGFKEYEDGEVTLKDDNVCDMARVLYFIYTDVPGTVMYRGMLAFEPPLSPRYQYDSTRNHALLDFLPAGYLTSDDGLIANEETRGPKEVKRAMWELADKYMMPRLKWAIAESMIRDVELALIVVHGVNDEWGLRAFVEIFEATYHLLVNDFDSTVQMRRLRAEMAKLLVQSKFQLARETPSGNCELYVLSPQITEAHVGVHTEYQNMRTSILEIDASFARVYADCMEFALQNIYQQAPFLGGNPRVWDHMTVRMTGSRRDTTLRIN